MAETTKPYPSPEKLSEQLQNLCWRIAVELRAIYTTVQTKISQSDADKLYLGIKDKAVSATTADSATKATQDGSGNVISQTYAKTSAIPTAMKGATASVAGSAGTVPAPAAGANAKYLRGDGTWQTPTNTTYNVMTAATSSAAGTSGLVPAPAAGKQAQYLRGDGTWATPTNTTYNVMTAATASAAGKAGLVPQPSAGANAKFLRGDGTWQTVLTSQTKADWNATSGDGVINNKPTIPTVDLALSTTSTNAISNSAVTNQINTNANLSGRRYEISMTQLGYTVNQSVAVADFLTLLASKGYRNGDIISFAWSNANMAYVTDGTNTLEVNGGTLVIGRLQAHTTTWTSSQALWYSNGVGSHTVHMLYCTTAEGTTPYCKGVVPLASNTDIASSTPSGTLVPFAGTTVPSGWLLCNGANVSRTTYAKLFAAIGTKWGTGNGSTTFTLPNCNGRFLEGTTTTSNVGTYVSAGLPNISGYSESLVWTSNGVRGYGAFTGSYSQGVGGGTAYWHYGRLVYSANKSSSIYSGTTVQPPSARVLIIIKT